MRLVAGIAAIPGDLDVRAARKEADAWSIEGGVLVKAKLPLLTAVTPEAIAAYCYVDGRIDADVWRSGSGIQCRTLSRGAEHIESEEHFEAVQLVFVGLGIARRTH
ncbi:MAG: hypothetical protein IPK72_21250 [Candidatus Eisenbacteria bacterium]|nr:hypothetical protein [Candidatus Eisenbacteria bacterium]